MSASNEEPAATSNDEGQAKPFRFKGEDDEKTSEAHESSRKRHRHHHSFRHRSRGFKRSKPTHLGDDAAQQGASTRNLGRDQAFQESLFDAMGDDEGAAFWEGVYGQPIHNYPNGYVDEETGEMGQMDDEEYAQYVRRKMWEKSREGIEATREEQKREKARKKTEKLKEERPTKPNEGPHNNFVFDLEIEASLGRGQRRKDQKRWYQLWKDYLQRWDDLQALAKDVNRPADQTNLFLRNKIAWPVESGKRQDINAEQIERFTRRGTENLNGRDTSPEDALLAALKLERVRWHPDKIQQRYGFMEIDEVTMKGVTATFQVFDRMWNERRSTTNI